MSLKVAVIYYSSTGNVHALAEAVAEGAAETGAEVRLRRVPELAPPEAIDSNPRWRAHADATAHIPVATHDDLRWADAYAFGTPARYGNVSSQLKQFIDTTAALWGPVSCPTRPRPRSPRRSIATAATRPRCSRSTRRCITGAR
jgi:NAD(P)H dehydrogenase (quinone)